jgi:benzoylformate decarboxylase
MIDHSRRTQEKKRERTLFTKRMTDAGIYSVSDVVASDPSFTEFTITLNQKPNTVPDFTVRPETSRMLTNVTGGEAMAEFLVAWGIPYVFGLAGSEETGFLDALVDHPELRYITCLHESVAMSMADGYSRSTGHTSIVQLHSVAGVAYALGQLAGSYLDRIPIVVTAGRQSTNFRGQDGFLESPHLTELPRDYTRWVWDVMHAGTITDVLRRAFLLAEAPPGGPSFVTFSKDLWEQTIPATEIIPRSRSRVSGASAPPAEHITAIVDNLLKAERPVLFLGNECIRHEISEEIAGIAEAIGAMVMLSIKIPCVFPNTHPNFVGEVGDDPQLLPGIDCFWSLGGHMFKTFNLPEQPLISHSATIMHTSLVATDVGRNYPVDVAAIASIKITAAQVLEQLHKRNLDDATILARNQRIREYTASQRRIHLKTAEEEWDHRPIATSRLMIELNRIIDSNAEVVSELITSDPYPRRYLDFDHRVAPEHRRRHYYSTSGVLGWGVGAAIGTKIGQPAKEVWCLTGDGSINFGSQALWTAARYEVPIGVVIFNNGQYQANRQNQNLYRKRMFQTGKYIGVNLGHPDIDYVKLAGAYGVAGESVSNPDQLTATLMRCKQTLSEGRPYLVDVKIEKRFAGNDSDWYDFYSIAHQIPHRN